MISELTEITEAPERRTLRGWIFYDRDCRTCRDLALRLESVFGRRGFRFEPLQERWVQQRLNLTPAEALEEMRVLTAEGGVFGGVDAIIFLARQIRWAAPLHVIARSPAFRAALDRIYRWIAAHRSCALPHVPAPSIVWRTRWVGLATLPLLALLTRPFLRGWGFMWAMAFALFLGCKWHDRHCCRACLLALSSAIRQSSDSSVHADDRRPMKTLLQLGGLLHFVILIASALTPHVLDWRTNLAALNPFLRRLFWVYGAFIVLVIIAFGALSLRHADELASAAPLARSICAIIAIFWLARLTVQLFVFNARPFLTTNFLRFGYHGLTLAFTALVLIYGYAAI